MNVKFERKCSYHYLQTRVIYISTLIYIRNIISGTKNIKYKKIKVEPIIDADTLLLVKYFVTSNISHSSLENIYLRKLWNKVVGTKSFDETILPEVYRKLKIKLKEKINNSEYIWLITDIWTAKQNSDFFGLVTSVMNENFTGEVFVANSMRMPGNIHTAEYIKEAIETMLN